MWVCLNDAFVSAVQDHDDPSRLVVRARRKEHLERLFPGRVIVMTPDRDYAARVFVSRDEFASVMADRIEKIDYDNFKSSVDDRQLRDLYKKFWGQHWSYQNEARETDRSRDSAWGDGDVEFDRGD